MAPVQNATDETSVLMSPLELCPMEVWHYYVFPRLDTEELIAVYNTCKFFRDLLEHSKNLWVFPAVFPHVYKYLDKKAALSVRPVCKAWSKTLDQYLDSLYRNEFKFYDEDSKTFKHDSNRILTNEHEPTRLEEGYVLKDVEGVRALLQKVRNKENPMTSLPGGKLVAMLSYQPFFFFDQDDNDDIPEMVVEALSGIVAILEAIGRSLRYLKLILYAYVRINQENPVDGWFYRHLLRCLAAVPNLRFLKLGLIAEIRYLNDNVDPATRRRQMVEAMNMHPLPLTPCLEYFEPIRFYFGEERTPIVDHLFQHYTRAPIKWNWIDERKDLIHAPPPESLGTLKELIYRDLEHGESIRGYPAPTLTTLRLRLEFLNMYDPDLGVYVLRELDATRVMESLNNLFPLLENLSIECYEWVRPDFKHLSPLPGNITYPKVRTLRLLVAGVISYNFLRCFPSLENFYVINDRLTFGPQQLPLTESQHEAANWFDWDRLEHSRAWTALPNLQFISFKLIEEYLMLGLRIVNESDFHPLETRECRRPRPMQQ